MSGVHQQTSECDHAKLNNENLQKASTRWNFRDTLHRLIPYLKPYRKRFLLGFLSVVATNIVAVLSPWVLKYGIEDLQAGVTASKIYYYAALLVAVALVAGVFRYLMRRIIISISRHIEYDLRVQYFAHLQQLSPSFFDHQQTGDLMTRATSDIESIRMVVGPAIMYSMDTLLRALFALSFMSAISVPLTLFLLCLAPIISGLIYFLARKIHSYTLRVQNRYSELNNMIQEHLSGIRVVRAYCQEEPEKRLFTSLNKRYIDASMKLVKVQAALIPFFYSIFGIGMAIILYIGGRAIIAGTMSLGDFVAFSAYIAMLAWPVMAVGWVLNLYQRGSASMQRLQKILGTKPEIVTAADAVFIKSINGKINFKNVSFSYPGSKGYALQDINLTIPAGFSLGIVGQVGAGKSSLVKLIPRLYEVSAGEISIDGKNVKKIPLNILRKEVAVVPQESFLFSDQLRNNILFSNPEQNEERLLQVAEIANLHADVTRFPDGFDTWIGERGINLSGGQKQRVCLARALAADPRILILDDCFSAVDINTEAEILRKLRSEVKGKTVIIIAHRISTLQWADQIIVMEAGRIVEQGTHEELLNLGRRYARLYSKQLLEAELKSAG